MKKSDLRRIIREEINEIKVQKDLYEELAALEHEQWVGWAKDIADTEKINSERVERWKKLFVPYSELSQEEKDKDREWVDKVMKIIARETGREKI